MEINKERYFKQQSCPSHRFQDLVLNACREFKVDPKGKGMIFGRIGKMKKQNLQDSYIESKIEYIVNEVRELNPERPDRYLVALAFKYL